MYENVLRTYAQLIYFNIYFYRERKNFIHFHSTFCITYIKLIKLTHDQFFSLLNYLNFSNSVFILTFENKTYPHA